MNGKIEYGIEGAFKMDLFSGEQFHSTTDWFSNFITPTGLMYPNLYAFADCFRYLSLGRSTSNHSGTISLGSLGTTGLLDPIGSYTTSNGSNQTANYIDWRGYATGEFNSNCGTVLSETGPRFYRAWYIPTGKQNLSMNEPQGGGLSIGEFMVSPSNATDSTGKYAFSRVIRNLFIPNGFRAVVSYQLKMNIRNTGYTVFSGGSFRTGNAEVENDFNLVKTWSNLSGYYRQVYHGLRCVDNYGMTFVPKFGDGMEPTSRNLAKTIWYLSPDNSQFQVNPTGGTQLVASNSYISNGLMSHIKNLLGLKSAISYTNAPNATDTDLNNHYTDNNPSISALPSDIVLSNIRIGGTSPLKLPQIANYTSGDANLTSFTYQTSQDVSNRFISYATPGVNKFNPFFSDFGKLAAFTSATNALPISMTGQNLITGRKKTVSRRSIFSPVSSLGYNTRFGSLVYGFQSSTDNDGISIYYPMIDCLFFDSSGRSLMPHYRFISGIHLVERGTGIAEAFMMLSGISGDNIFKFPLRSTFNGPYSGTSILHSKINEVVSTVGGASLAAGFLFSGGFNTSFGGITGSFSDGTTTFNNGLGAVFGVVVPSGFYDLKPDLGLADHSLTNVTEPSFTGKIYWPYISDDKQIVLITSGVKFYHPDIARAILDSGFNFGPNQMVKKVEFELLDSSNGTVLQPTSSTMLFGPSGSTTGPNLPSGYYLTTSPFNGGQISATDFVNNTSASFTGYIIPHYRIGGNLSGSTWFSTIPIDAFTFTVNKSNSTISGNTYTKVTSFFSTVTTAPSQRGFPNGTGSPIRNGDRLGVFFSGTEAGSPLYLTYVSGQQNGANSKLFGFSPSGIAYLTNFCLPSGYAIHGENYGPTGYRLSPNFAPPNYYGNNLQSASQGGEYPALSLDNGLEVYLDISWSSPCGPFVAGGTCNEPI
jgi:hypothetical protein